jgi:hypothetical protein
MKGGFPWLVRCARPAGTIDFCSAMASLVSPVQNIICPHRTLFHFISPYRLATWAGSRAGSPVSLSLILTRHSASN